MKKLFSIIALACVFGASFVIVGCSQNVADTTDQEVDIDLPAQEDENKLSPEDQETNEGIAKRTNSKVRGSCNSILANSVCIDYIGSYRTEKTMKLHCEGGGNLYSRDACPYSEIGGCRTSAGQNVENILWSYNYGGDPITPDVLPYSRQACNALPMADRTLPQY